MTESDRSGIFVERKQCIACGSSNLSLLSRAAFEDEPVCSFIANDPWGESPLPYLAGEHWELVACCQCDQVFHKRIIGAEWEETLFSKWMSKGAIDEFEERIGARTARRKFEKARALTRHVLKIEALTASTRGETAMRIMDFGCGWGEFLSIAKGFGAEPYGVDADPDRRESTKEKEIKIFASLDEMDPDLRGNLHAVTLFQVLEHLPAPLSLLETLADWVMPDGILVLETPNCSGVTGIRTVKDYRAVNPLSHINAFTPKSLSAIAKRAGFDSIFPGVAHATTSPVQTMKTEIKRLIGPFLPSTTDLYFRRK